MSYVLVVDDDNDDRDLFCEALNHVNPFITCIIARDGEEALYGLKLNHFPKPALIFLDINMPRVNGIQCLTELKKDIALRSIPVVICTTSKSNEEKELTAKLGAAKFITKPTSFKEFCMELKSILATQDLVIE
jgi:CheY-like chemotaxis protein